MSHKSKSTPEIEPRAVSVDGFCAAISIGRTSAYEAINDGDVETLLYKGRRLVTVASIDELIKKRALRGAR